MAAQKRELTLLPSAARTTTTASPDQTLKGETINARGLLIIVDVTALTATPSITLSIQGKDPASGKLITHEYNVEGPVAIMLSTTAIDLDEELLNRCIVLTVDEGREQTRAIHRMQRRKRTLEGLVAHKKLSKQRFSQGYEIKDLYGSYISRL